MFDRNGSQKPSTVYTPTEAHERFGEDVIDLTEGREDLSLSAQKDRAQAGMLERLNRMNAHKAKVAAQARLAQQIMIYADDACLSPLATIEMLVSTLTTL
jgi:hypothetical protein